MKRIGSFQPLFLWASVLALLPSTPRAAPPETGRPAAVLDAAQARDLIRERSGDPGFVILDVRTEGEFASGHLEGAILLDFRSDRFQERLSRLDRDRTYLVYCRTGNRSGSAVRRMEELGFPDVHHMAGGVVGWQEAGFPLAR